MKYRIGMRMYPLFESHLLVSLEKGIQYFESCGGHRANLKAMLDTQAIEYEEV